MLTLLFWIAALQAPATAPRDACTAQNLVGTWRITEKDEKPYRGDVVTYKHVTPTHWVVTVLDPAQDNRVVRTHGGSWALVGGIYRDPIAFGFGDTYEAWLKTRHVLNLHCSRTGDTWRIELHTSSGQIRSEVWQRMPAGM